MDTFKIEKKNVRMIAHRGLSGIEQENTNAAFVAAGNRSYYGIETDIHRTADGRFVISHDDNLKRVSGEDVLLKAKTLSELQSIVLLDKDGTKNREDLRVSVLENYISICKKYGKHSVLELKTEFSDEQIAEIIEIIKSFDYLESTTFISFNYYSLMQVRRVCPTQSVQYLFSEFNDERLSKLIKDRIDVDVYYEALTKEMADFLHQNGLKVNCWTVDDKQKAEELAEWGVDFITTNILE